MPSQHLRPSPLVFATSALIVGLLPGASTAQVPPPSPGLDAACVAKCQQEYDQSVSLAAGRLGGKRYYIAMGSGQCDTPWNTTSNACATDFLACDGKCGLYDLACKTPCFAALQPCCHANEVGNAAHARQVCLAACPKAATPAAPARTVDLLDNPKLGGALSEKLTPEERRATLYESDNLLRQKAFEEVRDKMRQMHTAFAVVSGGEGRLWVLRPDGTTVQMDRDLARMLRRSNKSDSQVQFALDQLETLGFGRAEAIGIASSIDAPDYFKPGEVLHFPPDGGWAKGVMEQYRASSEHSSIRGTINGGGDFI